MNWFTFAEIKYLGELFGAAAVRTQALQSAEMAGENFSTLLGLR